MILGQLIGFAVAILIVLNLPASAGGFITGIAIGFICITIGGAIGSKMEG